LDLHSFLTFRSGKRQIVTVSRVRPFLPWLLLASAGCFQASSPESGISGEQQGCGDDCGRSTAAGRSGAGGSGGAASSSASGSSSGSSGSSTTSGGDSSASTGTGSTGGSSGGCAPTNETVCPKLAICGISTNCSPGSTLFASQVVDILSCSELGGASVTAIDTNGVPVQGAGASATTESDGAFAMCLPGESPFSIQITQSQYPTTYYAEMLDVSLEYVAQMATLSINELSAFASFLIGSGSFEPNTALVVVKLTGSNCASAFAGWSFALSVPDGGAIPDGGYQLVYLGSDGLPSAAQTTTSSNGAGLFYNIDPAISDFVIVNLTNPDAGTCIPINTTVGFTGRVYLSGNSVALDPIIMP
jgi:hypothetical protein